MRSRGGLLYVVRHGHRRLVTVGALVLALAAGSVPAEATPPKAPSAVASAEDSSPSRPSVSKAASGGTGTARVTISHYVRAGALNPTGTAASLELARPGQDGIATFTAAAGDYLSLGSTATTVPSYDDRDQRTGRQVDHQLHVRARP